MKKHLIIALVLLLTLPAIAQVARIRPKLGGTPQQDITLTIVAPRGLQFWLYVDDVPQNEEPVRSICIRNLWNDDFYVRVELNNEVQNCVGQFVDLTQSQTFSIIHAGQCFGLELSQAHIKPELTMDLKLPKEHTMLDSPGIVHPMPPTYFGMSPEDYDDAYRLISNESFDSSKLTVAKQVVSSNPMTANQILNICKLFSFESNKLEFAKFAYPNCVEKNKYYLINEVFKYDSSKRELDEFIKGQ